MLLLGPQTRAKPQKHRETFYRFTLRFRLFLGGSSTPSEHTPIIPLEGGKSAAYSGCPALTEVLREGVSDGCSGGGSLELRWMMYVGYHMAPSTISDSFFRLHLASSGSLCHLLNSCLFPGL